MKKLVLAFFVLALSAAASSAADMAPAPRYTKAPVVMAPVASWTGCYVGNNIGYGNEKNTTYDPGISAPGTFGPAGSSTAGGVVGGGQVGCDIRSGSWVFGVQGMFDGTSLSSSHGNPLSGTGTEAMGIRTPWFATETGRIGYTVTPQTLLYAKGGLVEARFNYTDNDPTVNVALLTPYFGSANSTRVGYTLGAGIEYALASNWSVFAEYNYMDFGRKTVNFTYPAPTPVANSAPYLYRETEITQTVLIGVNYRFGWGGSVVAKY